MHTRPPAPAPPLTPSIAAALSALDPHASAPAPCDRSQSSNHAPALGLTRSSSDGHGGHALRHGEERRNWAQGPAAALAAPPAVQLPPLARASLAASLRPSCSTRAPRPPRLQQPQIILLKEGTDTSQGKPQLISNINACYAVADVVRWQRRAAPGSVPRSSTRRGLGQRRRPFRAGTTLLLRCSSHRHCHASRACRCRASRRLRRPPAINPRPCAPGAHHAGPARHGQADAHGARGHRVQRWSHHHEGAPPLPL